ncbi:RagB/SusD family nutrient uptake outer membrane protein [uncultured Alistipes sp.]|uniref:RagB/SusD family nutrient uptake outer membrane protein n=1 Tax=uncultured Alistipes sp. TaxID=538949 RepID=UPI002593837F|nr:RagB/SusD family nutrient uptake outer membrane protein [uncultured Alistipes sp.]
MKKVQHILLCASLLLADACSLLDTESQDFIDPKKYYKTEEQLQSALNGVYATLAQTSLYGAMMLGRMGLSADIGYEAYTVDEGTVGYYDVNPADSKIRNYWRDLYDGIGRANLLLENIGNPEMDEADRDNIRGQALFLRAYYHFLLTTRFGDVPLVLHTPASGKLSDVRIPQTPQREVYLKIIEDMETAAGQVKPIGEVECGGRISQSAVWGILARVCLYMAGEPVNEPGMYAKAKEYAAKVIGTGYHALNLSYQQVFINYIQDKYDTRESIFEVEFYGNNVGTYSTTAGQVGRNNGIKFTNTDMPEVGYSIGSIRATPYFFQLFEEDDERRDWSIANYTLSDSGEKETVSANNMWIRFCGKFRREYELITPKSTTHTSTNFPLLRYSDVLLMYAEAVAADAGSDATELTAAYEQVNKVRRRGYGRDLNTPAEGVDLPVEGAVSLLEAVKDERARELGHELLRKDDLIRWGEFYDRMQSIRSTVPQTYTSNYYVAARLYYGNVQRRDVLWPIPTYELSVNPYLVQNNGW